MTASNAIHDQVAQAFLNWKPSDVDRFNGTSWANLISLVIGDGAIDGDTKIDVSHGQRMIAAQLLLKALNAAAVRRRGDILGRLRERLGYYASDPVEFYKSYALPPAAPPVSTGLFHGVRVSTAGRDDARLVRHEVLAALVLAAYERDPNWKPTEADMAALIQRVGLR